MALTSKPKKTDTNPKEADIENFINQGGSSFQEPAKAKEVDRVEEEEDQLKVVNVHLYQSQLEEIEKHLQSIPKRDRPSRHKWMVDAILEKLEKRKK